MVFDRPSRWVLVSCKWWPGSAGRHWAWHGKRAQFP
jgi:hypothetical protein